MKKVTVAARLETMRVHYVIVAARLRGLRDFLSGQPADVPKAWATEEFLPADLPRLQTAWLEGYHEAWASEAWKLMVGRADRAATLADGFQARVTHLEDEARQRYCVGHRRKFPLASEGCPACLFRLATDGLKYRAAFEHYGGHTEECSTHQNKACDCGYQEVMDARF